MTEAAAEVGDRVLKQLEDAWNSANGDAFGAPFAEDADFVTIRGEHYTGRVAIAKGHQAIFDSIYKGSVARFETVVAKQLADGVLTSAVAGADRTGGPPCGRAHGAFQPRPVPPGRRRLADRGVPQHEVAPPAGSS
jgi:uncharacterized protein (TIGR02246 family)